MSIDTKTLELYRICKCCVLGNQKQNDLAKSGVSKKNEDDCYQEKIHFQAMNLDFSSSSDSICQNLVWMVLPNKGHNVNKIYGF